MSDIGWGGDGRGTGRVVDAEANQRPEALEQTGPCHGSYLTGPRIAQPRSQLCAGARCVRLRTGTSWNSGRALVSRWVTSLMGTAIFCTLSANSASLACSQQFSTRSVESNPWAEAGGPECACRIERPNLRRRGGGHMTPIAEGSPHKVTGRLGY